MEKEDKKKTINDAKVNLANLQRFCTEMKKIKDYYDPLIKAAGKNTVEATRLRSEYAKKILALYASCGFKPKKPADKTKN